METTPTTQSKRPWRTTIRSGFQFTLGAATVLPFVAAGVFTDLEQAPVFVLQALAVSTAITRTMAIPQVEAWLRASFPWLAADTE